MEACGELWALLVAHRGPLLQYGSVWALTHVTVEYVIPALVPGIFACLARDGKTPQHRVNKDARTKAVAVLMAVWAVALALYGLATTEGRELVHQNYGSTWVTRQLTYVAASYFIWDVAVCILDAEPFGYHVHGWACLLTFIAALRPFQHYMSMYVLLFEGSTVFLHWRKYLLQTKQTAGRTFAVVQALFGATFVFFRVIVGTAALVPWASRMWALIHSGDAHSVEICFMFLLLCTVLSSLNMLWSYQILATAFCRRRSSTHHDIPVSLVTKGRRVKRSACGAGRRNSSVSTPADVLVPRLSCAGIAPSLCRARARNLLAGPCL